MKKKFLIMSALTFLIPVGAMAAETSTVTAGSTEITVPEGSKAVVTTDATGDTKVEVKPDEKKRGPRDAITGEPVKIDNAAVKEKPKSERDRLRSKMKSGPERK
jgi:hypothetical protein